MNEENERKVALLYLEHIKCVVRNGKIIIRYPYIEIMGHMSEIPHLFIDLPVIFHDKSKLAGYGKIPDFLDCIAIKDLPLLDDDEMVTQIVSGENNEYVEDTQIFVVYYSCYTGNEDIGFGVDIGHETKVIFVKEEDKYHYYRPTTLKTSNVYLTLQDKEFKLSANDIPSLIMYKDTPFEKYDTVSIDKHLLNLKHIAVVY